MFEDLGLISYSEAWELQKRLFQESIDLKKNRQITSQKILICEHPHVITLGKNANKANLLFSHEELMSRGVETFNVDRGGDVTYHGQGQIMVYPILDLEKLSIGLKAYIEMLEEVVIKTLSVFHIQAFRLEDAPGVWVGNSENKMMCRKICAIGVRSSMYITMHGFALNVNPDLSFFKMINPCGFIDRGVTSMKVELNNVIDKEKVKDTIKIIFANEILKKGIA